MDPCFNHLPADLARHRVLDTAQSAPFCGFSVPHRRRLYRAGKLPKRVRLSSRKYGWRIGDLIDLIEASCADASECDEDAPDILARARGPQVQTQKAAATRASTHSCHMRSCPSARPAVVALLAL